ncbi:MAG: CvpA family protein [Lachnospiraceae bacterium]|nr:CvpA family protein [Lachnospiraceae bacterium]
MDNYLLIAVGIIFFICTIIGFVKGFVRFAVSLGATVLTIVVLIVVTPYVSKALTKYTPIDTVIKDGFVGMLIESSEQKMAEELAASEGTDNVDEIKEAIAAKDLSLQEQIAAINQANLPMFLKEALLDNNNSEVYKALGVETFAEYVGAYIAKMVINILSFLVTFLVVTILIRMTVFSLDFIAELPVLHGINRVAGAMTGSLLALIIVWIGFLVITLLYGTEFGKSCFASIENSKILTLLYNKNPILGGLIAFR